MPSLDLKLHRAHKLLSREASFETTGLNSLTQRSRTWSVHAVNNQRLQSLGQV